MRIRARVVAGIASLSNKCCPLSNVACIFALLVRLLDRRIHLTSAICMGSISSFFRNVFFTKASHDMGASSRKSCTKEEYTAPSGTPFIVGEKGEGHVIFSPSIWHVGVKNAITVLNDKRPASTEFSKTAYHTTVCGAHLNVFLCHLHP